MRVSGGRKRLYVTQPGAYLQHQGAEIDGMTWSWQKLRELPRFQKDADSQMEGNEEHCQPEVGEADAKETCWAFVEAYDLPPLSVHSSFNSSHSVEMSMRPADRQWRRSMTPSSILKHRVPQPISPLSENRPRAFSSGRQRPASASIIEQPYSGSSKRRLNSSPVKQTSASHDQSRIASVAMSKPKRRRVTHASSSPLQLQETTVPIWSKTPRQSREPLSPSAPSYPELPRTNSDVASKGKSTPFAYATPHSGPVTRRREPEDFIGGDTEPDSDDDNAKLSGHGNDDEQSWRGVDDRTEASGNSNVDEDAAGAEDPSSFSGEDSGFGSEDNSEDEGSGSEFFDYGGHDHDQNDDEDGEDVFDTLLGVLHRV